MTVGSEERLRAAAKHTARLLSETSSRLVFAESCTSGLLAATLSAVPGISEHFCGSFVTYRESLKSEALGVDPDTIQTHTAVSDPTTQAMAVGALSRCSEATITLAITGHLGPGAPAELDGVIFIACRVRDGQKPAARRFQLEATDRVDRQLEACELAFTELNSVLKSIATV